MSSWLRRRPRHRLPPVEDPEEIVAGVGRGYAPRRVHADQRRRRVGEIEFDEVSPGKVELGSEEELRRNRRLVSSAGRNR